MTHVTADRVLESTTTTGTGALTLAGALTGFRAFSGIATVGDTCWYAAWAVDANGNTTGEYEEGLGTYSAASTLTRTTVLVSSNSNALVSFAAGTKYVALALLAPRTLQLDNELATLLPLTTGAGGEPITPPADTLKLFAKSIGGRMMLAQKGPSGVDTVFQPHFGRNGIVMWIPAFNSTAITAIGMAALTATGTATAANYATTSLHTRSRRVDYLVTAAATTAVAGFRSPVNVWRRQEGFHLTLRAAPATGGAVATNRFFLGMALSTVAPTDVEPSSLTSIIGFGWDAADANARFMHNDGAGAATEVDLGASFAVPTADRAKLYSVSIFSAPAGAAVGISVVDETTGVRAVASLSTDLPALTDALGVRGYHSVGGTSSVVGMAFFGGHVDTDN